MERHRQEPVTGADELAELVIVIEVCFCWVVKALYSA